MEDDVERFPVRLALHAVNGHVEIKMLVPDMAQLMLQRLLLAGGREAGVDVDIEAAVVIRERHALHLRGQGDEADEGVGHGFLRASMIFTAWRTSSGVASCASLKSMRISSRSRREVRSCSSSAS